MLLAPRPLARPRLRPRLHRSPSRRPPSSFFPISNVAAASAPKSCAAPWSLAFGGSDATGAWDWKAAYDACEAATVLFLRKFGKALFRKSGSPANALPMLAKLANLLPTHTRRSVESQALQQFSTPVPLGSRPQRPQASRSSTAFWSPPLARGSSPCSPRSPALRSC